MVCLRFNFLMLKLTFDLIMSRCWYALENNSILHNLTIGGSIVLGDSKTLYSGIVV